MIRATVFCTDEDAAKDFFLEKMGFLLRSRLEEPETGDDRLLLEFNGTQIEVVCGKNSSAVGEQKVTIAANNSERIRRRLEKEGIPVSEYSLDPYTNLRTFSIQGPDNIKIIFIEE